MIIDGKAFAAKLRAQIKEEIAAKKLVPGLTVILVGDDPASHVYVRNKVKACHEVGIQSEELRLSASVSQEALIAEIQKLNADSSVHGILVQLPLPAHIKEHAVINAIDPRKDVDGFHVINAGKLATGQDGFVPCTPLGCLMLLQEVWARGKGQGASGAVASGPSPLAGLHAVVMGRSNIVGKPMAQLLLRESCTVTVVHSKTKNIQEITRQADILVTAMGKPKMVTGDWIKQGAVVIDVGINRLPDGKLTGDVDFDSAKDVASAITPVPGGVGPMTIACLLANTLKAAQSYS